MIYGYASGQRLDAQVEQLEAAGAKQVFREATGGGRMFDLVLTCLFKGDMLLVTRVDRLARSTRELLDKLKKIDKRSTKREAIFRSLGDGETWADTTTDGWRFTLAAVEHVAKIEHELARARISDGHQRAKADGVKFGRKPKLTSQQKNEAIKRRDAGYETCRDIAASYNVSASTISRLS